MRGAAVSISGVGASLEEMGTGEAIDGDILYFVRREGKISRETMMAEFPNSAATSMGRLSNHVQNGTDDRVHLIETPLVKTQPRFRGVSNDASASDHKHHRHSPAHLRSETASETR